MKIQYKIVIPFTLLFVIATLITALVTLSLMGRNLNAKVENRLSEISMMTSRVEFALNATILANLKVVSDTDVVTYKKDGTVLATTLDSQEQAELLRLIRSEGADGAASSPASALTMRNVQYAGLSYKVAYRTLDSPPDTIVALAAKTSDIAETQDEIARSVVLIALLIVAAMSLVAHFIARSVTSPVLGLVEFTRKVAAGDLSERADARGKDEVGRLAKAFNEMIEQLRRSKEKLLQSEKLALAGLLAARVAHDVRNPLSAIKMQTQLLLSRPKSESESREILQAILKHIDRVEWVVQGLLDPATPQELHLKTELVDEVLDDVLQVAEAQLKHRKIEVRRKYEAQGASLMLDRKRFQLALMNLIANAAEAMPNGGVLDIGIRWERNATETVIEISDEGVGIDPTVRERLFDPFVTTKREGVGLGLSNTKNVVERHGGTVELLPRDRRGTRAVIHMPIPDGKAPDARRYVSIEKVEKTRG
ncbi:MAG: HAMP domain-containing histidine kinase [Acidobacteria bacterium]|nr:HAMP domain-containing histidine kinase [Acidobacteriota bacterium]